MACCLVAQDLLDLSVNCCSVSENLCCTNDQIEEQLCCALELIEQLTCTSFCPIEECRLFDGSGNCKLFLGSNYLQTITTVKDVGCGDCATGDLTEPTNSFNYLEYTCGGYFPCGTKNIEVCGLWGYVMPPNIKKAVLLLALEYLNPGASGLDNSQGMVDSVNWNDFSINYNTADIDISLPTTGYVQIDRYIIPFIPTLSQIDIIIPHSDDCPDTCCSSKNKECNKCP